MIPSHASVSAFSLQALRAARPLLWTRPDNAATGAGVAFTLADVQAAHDRFARFAPLLAQLFPELEAAAGVIESPLRDAAAMQQALGLPAASGRLWIKADHALPVAGSIKARGGIHEVLEFTEKLALAHGLVAPGDDYRKLGAPAARACFAQYQVAVGSTGNLGLSIGVIASALGFRAAVHMSADAKEWKKARLRARGVEVVEHPGDYEKAVAAGRRQVQADAHGYFVDDERSASLFLGYAAAALRLREQIAQAGIVVDAEHPLFVYLPCGVGGAPGGIAFGLSLLYGAHAHCFFAEPVQSPCFLLRMMAGHGQLPGVPVPPSVYDIGLTNQTEADGLAVPRASDLAYAAVGQSLAGVYTVADDTLYGDLARLHDSEGLRIEPSAAAGFSGPRQLLGSLAGQQWLRQRGLRPHLARATHLAWTTGGLYVPAEEYDRFLSRGQRLAAAPPGADRRAVPPPLSSSMTMKTALIALGVTLAGALAAPAPASAQAGYPTRPITLVVPFPPGGATDVLGRVIAQKLGQELGQTVVVENRAGAGTAIGAGYVAKAAPDGYTLLVSSGTTFTVNPAIQAKLPYDPVKSFEPLGIVGRTGLALLANPQVPVKDLKELVAYAKAREKEPPAYGSFGAGTTAHFVGEAFLAAAGIKMIHVPYKGSAPAMTDLIGGQIPFSVDTVAAALPQSKLGKVRVLAVSAPARSAFLPDVPTFAEQGYPSVAMDTWLMFTAPRGLPADVKKKLETALRATVDSPDVRKSLEAQGFEAAFSSAAEGEALIQKELPQMRDVAQRANIKIE